MDREARMTAFSDYAGAQAAKCVSCGACAKACDIMGAVAPRLSGELCSDLAAGRFDERLSWFVPRCSLCGRCRFVCPEGVDFPNVIILARGEMARSGSLDLRGYRAMWVDCDWNAITLFRRSFRLDCTPYLRERADVVYLPSCSLLNEAFDLVEPALSWLRDYFGVEVSLLPDCCGMPLLEMGLLERYEAYEDYLWGKILDVGAADVVVACPNCLARLAERGVREGVRVRLIYELMHDAGFTAPLAEGFSTVAVHDSCPARGTETGRWVREILGAYELVEMDHCGDDSICCGSGGAVSMFDFALREIRAEKRRAEFFQTKADVCVSYCMSSCSTLQAPAARGRMLHVLELAFGRLVDHEGYQSKTASMWEGELGAVNAALLEGARCVCGGKEDV